MPPPRPRRKTIRPTNMVIYSAMIIIFLGYFFFLRKVFTKIDINDDYNYSNKYPRSSPAHREILASRTSIKVSSKSKQHNLESILLEGLPPLSVDNVASDSLLDSQMSMAELFNFTNTISQFHESNITSEHGHIIILSASGLCQKKLYYFVHFSIFIVYIYPVGRVGSSNLLHMLSRHEEIENVGDFLSPGA